MVAEAESGNRSFEIISSYHPVIAAQDFCKGLGKQL